jgi:16S rRNA (cytidine1402-2'-O)-methyltransferase
MIYLIPSELYEGEVKPIAPYVLDAVKECSVFFVENERTARRFLKRIWKEMVIDDYEWVALKKGEEFAALADFEKAIRSNKIIGILSEAGCPGVADPGQILVARAQSLGVVVKPLVGPSSILLALMASGLNGQSFAFNGYLPIDTGERKKAIQRMEEEAFRTGTTQIFIETPYRNNPLLKSILDCCRGETMLCIAANLTSPVNEFIKTRSVKKWKENDLPSLHKMPAIFLIGSTLSGTAYG